VKDFFDAAVRAKDIGFHAVNMDLIAGLPGEGVEEFTKSLKDVVSLSPENVTIHSLAIKRASKFGMEHVGQFATAEEAEAMIDASRAILQSAGYVPYYLYRQKYMAGNMENTGYALPGKECIYNVDIMEETVSILALGAGAVSKRVFGGQNRIERFVGVKDIANYITRVGEMAEKKRRLFD
jgi:oxygen-independent coproporphyrinogen-3 oxidase